MNTKSVSDGGRGSSHRRRFGNVWPGQCGRRENWRADLPCEQRMGIYLPGSSKDLRCNFAGSHFGERYIGTVSKFGVDIGYTSGGVLVWDVFAPTTGMKRGALSGGYAGASASATVGVGAGANVLVGGGGSITLQPVSIEGNSGLNVAAGIGSISLRFIGPEGPMGPGAMQGPPPGK